MPVASLLPSTPAKQPSTSTGSQGLVVSDLDLGSNVPVGRGTFLKPGGSGLGLR